MGRLRSIGLRTYISDRVAHQSHRSRAPHQVYPAHAACRTCCRALRMRVARSRHSRCCRWCPSRHRAHTGAGAPAPKRSTIRGASVVLYARHMGRPWAWASCLWLGAVPLWVRHDPALSSLKETLDPAKHDETEWAEFRVSAQARLVYETRNFNLRGWQRATNRGAAIETICNEVGFVPSFDLRSRHFPCGPNR